MSFGASGLRIRYAGSSRPALDGVTMDVPQGTLYAVLGPNGSGKSTLMRGLMGLIPAEAGEASLEGKPLSQWDRRELARTVGVVPQSETISFPITVSDLVGMGRYPHLGALSPVRAADREAVVRALERCDASPLAHRDVTTLSGGEVQRVRIARALAQEPRVLALDEPTASLDIRHEMSILRLLRSSVSQGLTVLLITHHLDLAARFADRLLLLADGHVAAEGAPIDVLRSEILTEVYGWPVAVEPDPVSGSPRITPLDRPPGPPR